VRARHRDDREVDGAGNVSQRPVRSDRLNVGRRRVDGIDRTAELALDEVVEHEPTDGVPRTRRADDGDRPRFEEGVEHRQRAGLSIPASLKPPAPRS
jgi:hypothetical protein